MFKPYLVYDDHNNMFCDRLQEKLENRTNIALTYVVCNDKVCGKCKTVDESEEKLHNHMVL